MKPRTAFHLLTLAMLSCVAHADGPRDNMPDKVRRVPRLGIEVTQEKREELEQELDKLNTEIEGLQAAIDEHPRLAERMPDIQVLYRAAYEALAYQEFFKESEIDDALDLVNLGMNRVKRIVLEIHRHKAISNALSDPKRKGHKLRLSPWLKSARDRLMVRGFVSKIDGTVQPYGLVFPENYSHESGKKYRLDVWFHGRGENSSENVFLTQRRKKIGVFAPKDAFVLHPYGRYSNAFKFAGEVDVLEAIEHVRKNYHIDNDRISVRGFSMGGAGCWQFAVHYADRWFAANPGAGFSETPEFLKFFQKETLKPTWYEEKLWRMYDCNLWATNLLHCPTVAYSGEDDIQKQAADIMEEALDELEVKLVHVIGPKTGHKYHPDAAEEVAKRFDALASVGRDKLPRRVDMVTYTLKYNRMHWITVDALEEHWEKASVVAEMMELEAEPRIEILTKNVAQLSIDIPAGHWPHRIDKPVKVFVNGKGGDVVRAMSDRSLNLTLTKQGDEWVSGKPAAGVAGSGLRKKHDLQGPIDDALMDSFIFVRPTRKSGNAKVHAWAKAELDRAIEHWRRHFRGHARVKNDTDITEEDIASSNLILWGDPQSNVMIERVTGKYELPITWNSDTLQVGKEKYDPATHGLIAIYPNPLNPKRYVVFNSSFTFREFAYLNNARQVPKLPDWAIVDTSTPPDSLWPGKIVNANFFDERWQLKSE